MNNAQGDVTGIFDEDGDLVVTYVCDNAWGYNPIPEGVMASTLGALNPLRYRGYVYDSETGYYYLQSRYYDPEIGRFINADAFASTGQGLLGNNMFAYCLNNPVNFTDKDGKSADDFWGWVGEQVGIFIYELITGEDHPQHQIDELENQILIEQVEMVSNGIDSVTNGAMHVIDSHIEAKHQVGEAIGNFIQDQFSTPEKAASTLNGAGIVIESAAAYCGAIAYGLSVPTLGISVTTAGTAATILAFASVGFYGAAWLIERIAMED